MAILTPLLALLCAGPAGLWAEDYSSLYRDTRQHLKALIAIDTSNPPGNEIFAAKYLKLQLDREGVPSRIFISTGTRASLIARLKGSGAKRPLILMCHTDVVPADPKEWGTDPFTPVEKEGYLYGRGAADIKSMCAAELAVLLRLKRAGTPLARDVVFFAEADEETGLPDRHILWLLEHHGGELDAEYAINEGGKTTWEDGRIGEIRIEAAEKMFLDIRLASRGTAGHASIPRPDNAVTALAQAVARLGAYSAPAELNPVARSFLERHAETAERELKAAIRAALKAAPGRALDKAADRLAGLSPELGAMLRDTIVPTMLAAGYKSNVIPAKAEATLNARLLPGRKPEEFAELLRGLIRDLPVELNYDLADRVVTEAMPPDNELTRAVAAAAAEVAPQARVMPFMAAWSTDSKELRARGVLTYGVDPPLTAEDETRVHGKDERIPLEGLDQYARMLLGIVTRLAAAETGAVGR